MHVAICVSGIPRCIYSIDFIKKVAENHEVYIFMHYWNDREQARLHSYNQIPTCDFDPMSYCLDNCRFEYNAEEFAPHIPYFQSLYDQIPADKKIRKDLGIFGMWYSVMKANEMREKYESENNIKFDCVVRSRFDAKFRHPDANIDFRNYDLNVIYMPDINICIENSINDQFAFSNGKNMSHYMNIYHKILEYSQKYFYGPEVMLGEHLTGYKIHKQYLIA